MKEQPKWLERAKETYNFHRSKLISTDDWILEKTARALRRSRGSVANDIVIARWCKTHEKEIERFEFAYQALEFIQKKQREQELQEIS